MDPDMTISNALCKIFSMDCERMTLKERWNTYHELLEAIYGHGSEYRLQDTSYTVLSMIIHKEKMQIKNLNEDEQNEDLEELYKAITLCMGQDFEVIDKTLQGESFDPDKFVQDSFNIIALMQELCYKIKRFDTQRMYLKMAMNFIERSFDKNGHFNLIDAILIESQTIVRPYIGCLKILNQVDIALQDISAIISAFERLGVKKPRNYGFLLWVKGEALETHNMQDEAILEYKKSIKCSKKYYLYHINSSNDDREVRDLVLAYEEPTKHLHELYTSLGRHQEAVEVLEKFFKTIGSMSQTKVKYLEPMKFNLAESYTKIRRYSEAKQYLLSITHVIRDGTKKSLAKEPLSKFTYNYISGIDAFDVLELYLQCIELKPSSKKKSLPKIAQHLLDHMKNDDFIAKEPQIIKTDGSFEKWLDTIVGVTLDCLKDNIQYADLNEIYALKLKHMMMSERKGSNNYIYDYYNRSMVYAIYRGIKFGLKVLKLLKEKNGLDFLPQVCQQMYDLYYEIGYVHEALDFRMESADYSSIESKWHMDMANCYLDIDQFDEAWSHIKDAHHDHCEGNTTALFFIKTGQYDLALKILMKNSQTDSFLIELKTLALFKLSRLQECLDLCTLQEDYKEKTSERERAEPGLKRSERKRVDLTTFMQLCSANMLDKSCSGSLIQKTHNKYYSNSSMKCLLEDVWKHVLNHKGVKGGGFNDFLTEIFNVLNNWKEKFHVKRNELRLYENAFKISNHIRMKKIYHEI